MMLPTNCCNASLLGLVSNCDCGGWGGAGRVVVALDAGPRRGLGADAHLLAQDTASSADPGQACFTAGLRHQQTQVQDACASTF